MRRIPFENEFDAAINWFGSFGYFSDAENLEVARGLYAAVKPGGQVLIEGLNKPWLLAHFEEKSEFTVDGILIRQRGRWNARTNRVHDTWRLTCGDEDERHKIVMRAYSGPEMRDLLRAVGCREIRLYGRVQGRLVNRLTRHSPRWMVVGRRPQDS
jgi:hypothetical protein